MKVQHRMHHLSWRIYLQPINNFLAYRFKNSSIHSVLTLHSYSTILPNSSHVSNRTHRLSYQSVMTFPLNSQKLSFGRSRTWLTCSTPFKPLFTSKWVHFLTIFQTLILKNYRFWKNSLQMRIWAVTILVELCLRGSFGNSHNRQWVEWTCLVGGLLTISKRVVTLVKWRTSNSTWMLSKKFKKVLHWCLIIIPSLVLLGRLSLTLISILCNFSKSS